MVDFYLIPLMVIPLINCFWNRIKIMIIGIIIIAAAAIVAERSEVLSLLK